MRTYIAVPTVLIFVLLVSGCLNGGNTDHTMQSAGIKVGFSNDGVPSLGNEFNLTIVYSDEVSTDESVNFHIAIPDEFELIYGDLEAEEVLVKEKSITIGLKTTKTGIYSVSSIACENERVVNGSFHCTDVGLGTIYIKVTEDDGIISLEPFEQSQVPVPFPKGPWNLIRES